jgi:hypothetical protein
MALVLFGISSPAASLTGTSPGLCTRPTTIVPGAAVGPLRIGMSVAEVVRILGSPSVVDRVPSEDPWQWRALATGHATRIASLSEAANGWAAVFYDSGPNTGLRLYGRSGRLARITLADVEGATGLSTCVTKEGIGLRSVETSIRRTYGSPQYSAAFSWDQYWIYDSRGISFRTAGAASAPNEVVITISIFAPSTFCQVALSDPRKISPELCR